MNENTFITTDMELVTVLLEVGHKLVDIDKKPMKTKRPGTSRVMFKFETGTNSVKKWLPDGKIIQEERTLKDTLVMYANDAIAIPARRLLNRLRNVKSMISNANVSGNPTDILFEDEA